MTKYDAAMHRLTYGWIIKVAFLKLHIERLRVDTGVCFAVNEKKWRDRDKIRVFLEFLRISNNYNYAYFAGSVHTRESPCGIRAQPLILLINFFKLKGSLPVSELRARYNQVADDSARSYPPMAWVRPRSLCPQRQPMQIRLQVSARLLNREIDLFHIIPSLTRLIIY